MNYVPVKNVGAPDHLNSPQTSEGPWVLGSRRSSSMHMRRRATLHKAPQRSLLWLVLSLLFCGGIVVWRARSAAVLVETVPRSRVSSTTTLAGGVVRPAAAALPLREAAPGLAAAPEAVVAAPESQETARSKKARFAVVARLPGAGVFVVSSTRAREFLTLRGCA